MVILFATLEYGMYFRNSQVVNDIATEAAFKAAREEATPAMTCPIYTTDDTTTDIACIGFGAPANDVVKKAASVVYKRRKQLGIITLNLVNSDPGLGSEPYAVYKLASAETRMVNSVATPILTVYVNYRNPETDGVGVQIVYLYRPILYGVALPIIGSTPITIIPDNIEMRSTFVRQLPAY